jgi:hypothetical protein
MELPLFKVWKYDMLVAPAQRNVSRHGRNETATLTTFLNNLVGTGYENNMMDAIAIFQRSRVLDLTSREEKVEFRHIIPDFLISFSPMNIYLLL